MINVPSVRHLRHLTALYDHGHFGRAAEACHVTQSTLSASIKELESILQVALVDRSKRRVVLTPVGVEAVDRARKIVKEIDELVSFTNASRDPLSGTLRMGAIPTIGPFLLPRVLPGLRKAYGRLKLYLMEDLTDRLIDLLEVNSTSCYLRCPMIADQWKSSLCLKTPLSWGCLANIRSREPSESNRSNYGSRTCCC